MTGGSLSPLRASSSLAAASRGIRETHIDSDIQTPFISGPFVDPPEGNFLEAQAAGFFASGKLRVLLAISTCQPGPANWLNFSKRHKISESPTFYQTFWTKKLPSAPHGDYNLRLTNVGNLLRFIHLPLQPRRLFSVHDSGEPDCLTAARMRQLRKNCSKYSQSIHRAYSVVS